MSSMAGEDDFEQLKKETIKTRLEKRKQKVQEQLLNKRTLHAKQMELAQPNEEYPEEKEVLKEDEDKKQKLNLNQYHKKAKRKSKKRCWYCGERTHFKRHCPNLNCFYCHKPGHFKKDCWKRKINILFDKLLQQENKKEKRKKWKMNKEKEHKRITNIYKHRLKESQFIQKEDKHILTCKNLEIGMFLEPTIPPDLQKLRLKPIAWKKVDVLVQKEERVEKLKLLDDFLNYCGCGAINLRKQEFISHINIKHRGKVPPRSQINLPAWTHAVLFTSDEIETLYCQTTADLT